MKKITSSLLINIGLCLLLCMTLSCTQHKRITFYGDAKNDLCRMLQQEGFNLQVASSPDQAIDKAPAGSAVVLTGLTYPRIDSANRITQSLLDKAVQKKLRLYIENPSAFPGLDIPAKPHEAAQERAVITGNVFGSDLPPMSLLDLHNCFVLPVQVDSPLIVLAKVVGFDKAAYGLTNTKVYPLLFKKRNALVALTALSNFETGRYGPNRSVQKVWTYILSYLTGNKHFTIRQWPVDVRPMYGRDDALPADARLTAVKKGVQWFFNGRFFIDSSWKADWLKYQGDGTRPFGPPVSQDKPNGDGTLGILEGHASTIYYDGTQEYRYWMRADVQGEVSMALAGAGRLLNNADYRNRATHLIDFVFRTSNLRAGNKNDPGSAVYGLIGWATTHPYVFYGDDNSRAILGMIAASAYLQTNRWDQQLAEAILANFRTTGQEGFRGERLEENDIIKNGWQYYQNRHVVHISPHFESWMWACYLWLYSKTKYEPLLKKTEHAIRITMEAYPDKWLWGSSMQTQRARMILPLAWLTRVDNTAEHRRWLDEMVNEILKYQADCGAIREEMGKGKGLFKELKSNSDYGSDEGSLIFKNGEKVAGMLYTCNFALFSLHEAAAATGNPKYSEAVGKLSDFLTRIQVQSKKHKDLDGAWFRAFDYGRWDYWASNSDAGWGAWCTLTGWIQSWIVTTQIQIEQKQSFWELTQQLAIGQTADSCIKKMLQSPPSERR
jgi:hypothetical protein